jgi:hypothetical protein
VSVIWDSIWIRFREVVDHLNKALGADEAFIVRVDHSTSDAFPFRAWASYSAPSSPGDEHLVLSLDFKRDAGEVRGHVDIARGDGLVLADQQIIDSIDEGSAGASEALRSAADAVERFVMAHRSLIESELKRERR